MKICIKKEVFFRAKIGPVLVFFSLLCLNCMGNNGEALLSHLLNNRMTIILKGTYATDNPLAWNEINGNQIFVDSDDNLSIQHQSAASCDPKMDGTCLYSYENLPLYIDFGGIRLSSQSKSLADISSVEDAEEFWNIASTDRQVYCNRYYGRSAESDSCLNDNGQKKFEEFMDGTGAIYPSRDIPNTPYLHTGVFVRRIVTGWATNDGELIKNAPFDNNTVSGANILSDVSAPPPPTDPNMEDRPGPAEWLPLHYRVSSGQSLQKGHDYLPIVLEIRFNIKENLMLHSYRAGEDSATSRQYNIVAFSDWRRNHSNAMTVKAADSRRMGGNVLSRSRFFYPHKVSRIDITNGASGGTRYYFALYGKGETDRDDRLPYAASPARSGSNNQLNHVMPGLYQLECRFDANNDGYPEMLNGSPVDILIPEQGQIVTTSHSCG